MNCIFLAHIIVITNLFHFVQFTIYYYYFAMISVAKRKSLFDDKPVEIQELTYIIKQDINSLNKQIAQLQEVRIIIDII